MKDLTELLRRFENMIRLGRIDQVKHVRPARVRVKTGGITTQWLRYFEVRAGDTRTWNPPTIGEQVVLLSPGGDLSGALVLGGLSQDEHPAPSDSPDETVCDFPDGANLKHNHATGAMSITGIKSLFIQASEHVHIKVPTITLDADQTTSTGKHTIEGLLSYLAGMSGKNGKGNATSISGNITHKDGDLESNGIVVHLHVHGGVLQGGALTEGPQ
jgi:phage baseplate assembly protein V